jgi:hypothetical protein
MNKLVILGLAVLCAGWFAWWISNYIKGSRRRALEVVSNGTGVYVEEYGPEVSLLEGTGLPFFVDGRSGVGKMLLHFPEEDGVKSWFFDYACVLGSGSGQHARSSTVALFEFAKGAFPDFHLSAGGDMVDDTEGLEPVDLAAFPKFPQGVKICGRDEAKLKAYFTAEKVSSLQAHEGWSVQASGRFMVLYKGLGIVKPARYQEFLDEGRKLAFNLA